MHWSDLSSELDAWCGEGRIASMWWRDDDAMAPGPALDRLAGIARELSVTVGLAAIPALASDTLAPWIESARVEVLQHGWAHRNHAAAGGKKSELGGGRAPGAVMAELSRGFETLQETMRGAWRPVLVPPWNRIDPALIPALPHAGFRGLSTFGPRPAAEPAPGLGQANCHVDVVDWRGGREFVGRDRAIAAVVAHLAARRTHSAASAERIGLPTHLAAWRARSVDPAEPTGLLTHHAVHEEETWTFVSHLLERTRNHPAVRWLTPGEAIFGSQVSGFDASESGDGFPLARSLPPRV